MDSPAEKAYLPALARPGIAFFPAVSLRSRGATHVGAAAQGAAVELWIACSRNAAHRPSEHPSSESISAGMCGHAISVVPRKAAAGTR